MLLANDYESAVGRAATPEAAWATFSEYFRDTVVDRLVYLHLPPIGAPDSRKPRLRAKGFPEELVTRYLGERLYCDNPALRQAHQRAEPVSRDEVCGVGAGQRTRTCVPRGVPEGRSRRRGRHSCLRAGWAHGPVRARISEGRAAAGPGGAEGVPVGLRLRAGASAVLRTPGAGARSAAGAVRPARPRSWPGWPAARATP